MSKLQVSYDDSSDEEDTITDYNVKAKFSEYKSDMLQLYQDKIDKAAQKAQKADKKFEALKANLQSAREERGKYDIGTSERQKANTRVQELKKKGEELEAQCKDTNAEAKKTIAIINGKISELQTQETHLLSFISHAAGIMVLYHPVVQKRYYELKKQLLTPAVELYSNAEVIDRLKTMIDKVVNWSMNTKVKAQEFQLKILVKVNEVLQSEDAKLHWASASDEERSELIQALFLNIKMEPYKEIINFRYNFDERVFDFVKPSTRKVLSNTDFDMSATASENFAVEYLAHQRLHNRSEKRCLKNDKDKCKDTTWKVSHDVTIELSNANTHTGCRNEIVKFSQHASIASYSQIIDLPQVDPKVLETCYINIKKATGAVTSETASLWYLLFGCEAIKNPSAMIHHSMIIDLVKAGKYVWKRIENEDEEKDEICFHEAAPMCAPNSIQPAMVLNDRYAKYMPVAYKYQPESNFFEGDLRVRESDLTMKWLQFKLGEMGSTALLAICIKDPQGIDVLWSLIENSFESWGMPSAVLQAQADLLGNDSEVEM